MREKFIHVLSSTKVRQFCIDNDYYTCGDCKAYENMFNMFYGKHVTPALLTRVAKDIKDHSHTEDTAEEIKTYLTRLLRVEIVNA